jgi:hypothetical protein
MHGMNIKNMYLRVSAMQQDVPEKNNNAYLSGQLKDWKWRG